MPNNANPAVVAYSVADPLLRNRVIGHYSDGKTWVTWHLAYATDGRRWEIVSESLDQLEHDQAEAHQHMMMPVIVEALQEIEIRLDAALHPVFDMDHETAISLVHEAHAEIRKLLGMPAIVEEVVLP